MKKVKLGRFVVANLIALATLTTTAKVTSILPKEVDIASTDYSQHHSPSNNRPPTIEAIISPSSSASPSAADYYYP